MNIDPAISLAVSLHAHKGVYALLLGSGVSKSAGIPTGWDVVLDLTRRVAVLKKEDPGQDPAEWYKKEFGKDPNYSDLVQALAPTPAERTSLLREYFEPNETEKEDGLKVPTAAHHAIARLVAGGFIKVIITTNFDRLLERALEAQGISPTVVSTPDHIVGMMPLPHVQCLIVKVHGDYLDTRIKNIPSELAHYESETDQLLDRLLVEYGLIVCGWSGEWDTALGDALIRNTRFRFSTYWMARGKPDGRADDLIKHRQAILLPIDSADGAFADLEAKVEALTNQNLVDPMSPRLAIATMKRFLSEPKYRIQLQDAVVNELALVRRQTNYEAMPLGSPVPDKTTYTDRVRKIEAICSKLVPMVATGVYWDEGERDLLWKRCVEILGKSDFRSGTTYEVWSRLQYYPLTLVAYAAGISAILRQRYSLFRMLLIEAKYTENGGVPEPMIRIIGTARSFYNEAAQWLHNREGKNKLHTPGSDWVVSRLGPMLNEAIGSDVDFENVFDELEFIVAIVSADVNGDWNLGRFAWRGSNHHATNWIVVRTEGEVARLGDKHHLLEAGLFNGSKEKLTAALAVVKEDSAKMRW